MTSYLNLKTASDPVPTGYPHEAVLNILDGLYGVRGAFRKADVPTFGFGSTPVIYRGEPSVRF